MIELDFFEDVSQSSEVILVFRECYSTLSLSITS